MLAFALVWSVGWSLYIVPSNIQGGDLDALFAEATCFHYTLGDSAPAGAVGRWLDRRPHHPPLPVVYALASTLLPGGLNLANTRLAYALLHPLMILMIYLILRRGSSWPAAAGAGALISALCPTLAGWTRMDYPDSLTAAFILVTILVIGSIRLASPRGALLLGLVVGLGSLTKLTYTAMMIVPAVVYLWGHRRDRWAMLGAGLATSVVAISAGWWYASRPGLILENYLGSVSGGMVREPGGDLGLLEILTWGSGEGPSFWMRLHAYFGLHPDHALVQVLGLVGLVLALRRGTLRQELGMVATLSLLAGLGLHLLLVDIEQRYMIPLCAVACIGAGQLAGRIIASHRKGLLTFLLIGALPLAGMSLYLTFKPEREFDQYRHGLMHPLRHPDLLCRTLSRYHGEGRRAVVMPGDQHVNEQLVHMIPDCLLRYGLPQPLGRIWSDPYVFERTEMLPFMRHAESDRSQPLYMLLVYMKRGLRIMSPNIAMPVWQTFIWLRAHPHRTVALATHPDSQFEIQVEVVYPAGGKEQDLAPVLFPGTHRYLRKATSLD